MSATAKAPRRVKVNAVAAEPIDVPVTRTPGPLVGYLDRLQGRTSALLERNADFIHDLRSTAPNMLLRACAGGLLFVAIFLPGSALPVLCAMISLGILAKPLLNLGVYFVVACSLRNDS